MDMLYHLYEHSLYLFSTSTKNFTGTSDWGQSSSSGNLNLLLFIFFLWAKWFTGTFKAVRKRFKAFGGEVSYPRSKETRQA